MCTTVAIAHLCADVTRAQLYIYTYIYIRIYTHILYECVLEQRAHISAPI